MTEDKWKSIDERNKKKKEEVAKKQQSDPTVPSMGEPTSGISPAPKGIVEKVKLSNVERKARIEALTLETKGKLEVWAHRIKNEVIVGKQRIDVLADEQLTLINKQYLENLRILDISNLDERATTLRELTEKTVKQLQKIQEMDVPDFMKEKNTDAALDGFNKLFDKIKSEEVTTLKS